jgi:hypothetical protein
MARSYRSLTQQSLHYLVRPHAAPPQHPISGEAAWRGDELGRRGQWQVRLSPAEVEELEAALAQARSTGKPLSQLAASDFPLPTLARRIADWARILRDGCGVQVLRGIPVERYSPADCERLFFCLGLHLGVPGAQNRNEELLGHVRSEGLSYQAKDVRGYRTSAALAYHCDLADVVGLFCLRTAKSGGTSRFVSSVTVWNELFARRPDLALRLFEPLQYDTRGDGGLNFVPMIPCRYFAGRLRTCYHADYFRTAQQHRGARRLSPRDAELLDLYDEITATPGLFLEMDFAPGDIQLLSNHTVLHARSDYVDHEEPERKRHLLRLWLSLPASRAPGEWPSLVSEAARLLGALAVGRLRDRMISNLG